MLSVTMICKVDRRSELKVTYIYHSCFSVELQNTILVFDYFQGKIPEFDNNKNIYVFSSHKHQDHFSLSIFKEFEKYSNVTFILSNDIKLNESYLVKNHISSKIKEQIINVQANKEYRIDSLIIETLKSTDKGVAFLVQAEKSQIYHAGDLNWWHWNGETTEYNTKMEDQFKKEIALIKNINIDIAFLPADSRQEDYFWWGFDYFMKNTGTRFVFPMHFWEDYSVIDRLEQIAAENGYRNNLYSVRRDGQQWEIQP
jgi:L-ascorbate metabolism protein UlaG (beta-lactamase superfamily)